MRKKTRKSQVEEPLRTEPDYEDQLQVNADYTLSLKKTSSKKINAKAKISKLKTKLAKVKQSTILAKYKAKNLQSRLNNLKSKESE